MYRSTSAVNHTLLHSLHAESSTRIWASANRKVSCCHYDNIAVMKRLCLMLVFTLQYQVGSRRLGGATPSSESQVQECNAHSAECPMLGQSLEEWALSSVHPFQKLLTLAAMKDSLEKVLFFGAPRTEPRVRKSGHVTRQY